MPGAPITNKYNPFCLSSFLAFRYVVKDGYEWQNGVKPEFPEVVETEQIKVKTSEEILSTLKELVKPLLGRNDVGILLSGGIDSAVLAALLPKGTPAYTIKFMADGAADESPAASIYAKHAGLNHKVVEVYWKDYEKHMDFLMKHKKAPMHPVEVGLYKAASLAASEGIKTLVLGNGADSTFGGLDKLLSRDWTFDEFVNRYTFVKPESVLKEPVSILPIYEEYRTCDAIDVVKFLKVLHGIGVIQAFDNAIGTAGCTSFQPYEELALGIPLDIKRIRNGETKYLLRTVFAQLYEGIEIPPKIAFARPMDKWLKDWVGPNRLEFKNDLNINDFTGEQKWLIYCLERFLNLMDGEIL